MRSNVLKKFSNDVSKATREEKPFLFIVDFELKKPLFFLLDDLPKNILLKTPHFSNTRIEEISVRKLALNLHPLSIDNYSEAFNKVKANISHGNSYLTNLTFPTAIDINYNLREIFYKSKAKYKLLIDNDFIVFSPETFIKIERDTISTYPMKGTIDASEENALETIMKDEKELSEHNTVIDLLRNDLSMVAKNVKVARYRYNDVISAGDRKLIQISSEITGLLQADWRANFGNLLLSILPAGSISGAPKKETISIIKDAELDLRGYYTGVFGVFDGSNIDSAVMIRYIEQRGDNFCYRSGGGITFMSDLKKEYNELISKVYVPFI